MVDIIVSQLGYRPADIKRFLLADNAFAGEVPPLRILNAESGDAVLEAALVYWGEKWGRHYWLCDVRERLPCGEYAAVVGEARSTRFPVEEHIFRERTLALTSVEQLKRREGDKLGWQDCGSDLRAVEGNAVQLMGLLACWESLREDGLLEQISRGADYLAVCQREDGSFVNEYYCENDRRSITLCALAATALAWANAATDEFRHLRAAKRGWEYLMGHEAYTREERLDEVAESRMIYGQYAPWIPPEQLRVRDKLLLVRAGVELYRRTNDVQYKSAALRLAEDICANHQFLDSDAYGIWGNFYAWKGHKIFQRAWEHAGWGYNCGAVFPDDISGLVSLLELFPGDPRCLGIRYALHQYAYGYLLRAAEQSPFQNYPLAMLESGELAFFGPAWHGFNGMYGMLAHSAMLLARLFEDPALEQIAINNLQFIVGQNPLELEGHTGVSFINGVGQVQPRFWSDIPGAVANGISASPQFQLVHADDLTDAPAHYTSEDWIVHSGGWLLGLAAVEAPAALKIKTLLEGVPVAADVRVEQVDYRTDKKGILRLTPPSGSVEITLSHGGQSLSVTRALIAGKCAEVVIDFAQWIQAELLWEDDGCVLRLRLEGSRPEPVDIRLYGVGADPEQRAFTAERSGDYPIPLINRTGRPVYLSAEVSGRFAGAVCESTMATGAMGGKRDGAMD